MGWQEGGEEVERKRTVHEVTMSLWVSFSGWAFYDTPRGFRLRIISFSLL